MPDLQGLGLSWAASMAGTRTRVAHPCRERLTSPLQCKAASAAECRQECSKCAKGCEWDANKGVGAVKGQVDGQVDGNARQKKV